MEENVGGVMRKEFYKEDLKALISQIEEQDSLLRLKRRWLMDLPLSQREQKRLSELLPPNDKILPESLLREDDVSYEDIRISIEMGFGAGKCAPKHHCLQEDVHISNPCVDFKKLLLYLDDLTNIGLYSIIKILTGGMIKFEKTNSSMKKTIRELLPKFFSCKDDISVAKMKLIFQLLKDPQNFRGNCIMPSIPSKEYHAAAVRVLDGLEDFSFRTLDAMRRKLGGSKGSDLTLQSPNKCGRGRDSLIKMIRNKCYKMLRNLGKSDEPPEALAAALGVAGLTLKLILNRPPATDFRKFSPEIEALQSDIAKAIWLLSDAKRVDLIVLRKVQLLMDPNAELSVRSLRMAVRNLLTEYLFECADMDKVPDCLIETLEVINKKSQFQRYKNQSSSEMLSNPHKLMEEEIEIEIECVLTVSAEAKQIVLELLPELDVDQDFSHAYVEDFANNDTLYFSDDDDADQPGGVHQQSEIHYPCVQTEGIGESSPKELKSPVSACENNGNVPLDYMHIAENGTYSFVRSNKSTEVSGQNMDKGEHQSGYAREQGLECSDPFEERTQNKLSTLSQSPASVRSSSQNSLRNLETTRFSVVTPKIEFSNFEACQNDLFDLQNKSGNLYLEIQEACDDTSMVAYRIVGQILDKIAMFEGIELYQGDHSYLRSGASVSEDTEEYPHAALVSKLFGIWSNKRKR